jgi:hypothetical protein
MPGKFPSIKKVTKYEVEGKELSTQSEARIYALKLKAINEMRTLLSVAINSQKTRQGNIDNVLFLMLEEVYRITPILLDYKKRLPNPKKVDEKDKNVESS